MDRQIQDYLILESHNIFIFKVPHPDLLKTDTLSMQEQSLFNELSLLNFNRFSEAVLFRTFNGCIGIFGEQFTGWNFPSDPLLSIKLYRLTKIDIIHLRNMKPAKGTGFCTITVEPESKELIFFFLLGDDKNWDFNFKKTPKLMKEISQFFRCDKIQVTEGYNC